MEACTHSFCYVCLKRRSTVNSTCPLCKRRFVSIRSPETDRRGGRTMYSRRGGDRPASGRHAPTFDDMARGLAYEENMWALPLVTRNGRFRGVGAGYFRAEPARANRLRGFISRELISRTDGTTTGTVGHPTWNA